MELLKRMGEKMARGNDAIPSWSGFNYQGKMAILCALQKINEEPDCLNAFLEIEAREDFVIGMGETSQALYQVKAVLSQPKCSHYIRATKGESVAQKLLRHRNETGNPSAKSFLVSAVAIPDWNEPSNCYQNDITLYSYEGKIVSLSLVRECVKKEIERYLCAQELPRNENDLERIYGNLCVFLDETVFRMHLEATEMRNYQIPLEEFTRIMQNTSVDIRGENDYYLKEKVYDELSEILEQSTTTFCETVCESGCKAGDCNADCAVHTLSEKFSSLRSVVDYIAVINPSILDWENALNYVSHANMEMIRDHIIYAFYCSQAMEKVKFHGQGIVFESKHSGAKNQQVLPTLLDFTRGNPKSLQTIFQNIQSNGRIKSSIAGNTLLARGVEGLSKKCLTEEQITGIWTELLRREDSIHNIYAGTEIVSEERFLEELNNL